MRSCASGYRGACGACAIRGVGFGEPACIEQICHSTLTALILLLVDAGKAGQVHSAHKAAAVSRADGRSRRVTHGCEFNQALSRTI